MKLVVILLGVCLSFPLFGANNVELEWNVKTNCGKVHSKYNEIQIDLPSNCDATLEVVFAIPENARLDDISFQYFIENGTLTGVSPKLEKLIKGGDLPDPRILDVGNVHKHNIELLINNPLSPISGSIVASSVSITNPVFDILQPGEKIKYLFQLKFKSNTKSKIALNIDNIQPGFTQFTLPVAPSGYFPTISSSSQASGPNNSDANSGETKTPIKHVILLLLENVSFDNMFGTYPLAQNLPGETPFFPLPDTSIPDNLLTIDPLTGGNYLTTNRNIGQFDTGFVNPIRLAPNQVLTNFESNKYTRLQLDVHNGLVDHYVVDQTTPSPMTIFADPLLPPFDATYGNGANIVMAYWDGNTFTGLWNYAQRYAMNDHCFQTGYGESIVGSLNWASGFNGDIVPEYPDLLLDVNLINIFFPGSFNFPPQLRFVKWGDLLACLNNVVLFDFIFPKMDLSIIEFLVEWFRLPESIRNTIQLPGVSGIVEFAQQFTANNINPKHKNIGNLLNRKNLTWGAFRSGWRPKQSLSDPNAIVIPAVDVFPPDIVAQLEAIIPEYTSLVELLHFSIDPTTPEGALGGLKIAEIVGPVSDIGDSMPFDYFASTSNPHFTPYSSLANVGKTDQANHTYDIDDFFNALDIGVLPAVSFIRLPSYQDGHPSYSNAFDNQVGVINLVNKIMASPFWQETVIFLQWDESNGNYDHKPPLLVKSSAWSNLDPRGQIARRGVKAGINKASLRAGYGPRIPFLAISPWVKPNHIDHHLTDQTSIIKFIEKNWNLPTIKKGSYNPLAGSLNGIFDFNPDRTLVPKVFLNPFTGLIESIEPS